MNGLRILEKAPAKINLSLDVRRKRPDGYHEVEMVMTTIDLADRVELTELAEDKVTVSSHNRFVPDDQRNLAYQAAMLMKERYGIKKGVSIFITKVIPVARGPCRRKRRCDAVFRGLNRLWDLKLSMNELAELGAEIGSDVSFCVHGGTALATGRGEKIRHIETPPHCWVVLAKPTIGVSTAEVYKRLKVDEIEHPDVQGMIASRLKRRIFKKCVTSSAMYSNLLH
nr:4-(cytidine 5'-diphospho)-2-C-methyl-D-erythritol kinase [Bacillus licheniformis]